MNYNEYVASEGKVLFNIRNFTYGNRIISRKDLSSVIIEVDLDVAKEYSEKFQNEKDKYNEELEKLRNNTTEKSIMTMNENDTYNKINNDDYIKTIATTLATELTIKYNTSKNITCIKYE